MNKCFAILASYLVTAIVMHVLFPFVRSIKITIVYTLSDNVTIRCVKAANIGRRSVEDEHTIATRVILIWNPADI